ncbi:hypothetical protein J8F10_29665 [Gemmata sp. G18]|uniref:Uncharacterized protein n=1 Tax=Gemmata palustris TaxID=2822762 RepID=A0ABS5C0B5_9BACT|nr:hypothetical protein [Gemmata palustris]MBP3959432.1 hypothetical protein [Gemmata palustris]
MTHPAVTNKFPAFLVGVCTPAAYRLWLFREMRSAGNWNHKVAMHRAVERAGAFDEYTGVPLRWDLLDEYAATPPQGFGVPSDLPTVQCVSGKPTFKVCARHIWAMKQSLSENEFVAVCRTLANVRGVDPNSKNPPAQKISSLPASSWLPEAEDCPGHLYKQSGDTVMFWGAWVHEDWVCRVTGRVGEMAVMEREQVTSAKAAEARVKQDEAARHEEGYEDLDYHQIVIKLRTDIFERDREGVSDWQDELIDEIRAALNQRALGFETGVNWGWWGVEIFCESVDPDKAAELFIKLLEKHKIIDYLSEISTKSGDSERIIFSPAK